jgi:hypothetical protein
MLKLLRDMKELIEPKPEAVLYCYGEYNSYVSIIQKLGVMVHRGAPTDEMLEKMPKPMLLIMDDLLYGIDEDFLSTLYTRKIHHRRIGVIFLTQHLYEKKLKVNLCNIL